MEGIEKITEKIRRDAQAEADRLRAETDAKVQAIRQEAQEIGRAHV